MKIRRYLCYGLRTELFPVLRGRDRSKFGAAVTVNLHANSLVAGAPDSEETGAIYSAVYDDISGWVLMETVFGEVAGDSFGASLDLVGRKMVVGAPTKLLAPRNAASISAGVVYMFEYSAVLNAWQRSGWLQGDVDSLADGGEFGAAVALGIDESFVPWVVVGAPKTDLSADIPDGGKVYTFKIPLSDGDTLPPLLGKGSNDLFGSDLDMSDDASRFAVGAPGGSGYFQIYEWNGTGWTMAHEGVGTSRNESFGASVAALTRNTFAVGGPGYDNNAGRIVIYSRQTSGGDEIIGEIIGENGDQVGWTSSISGGMLDDGSGGDERLVIVFVTSSQTATLKHGNTTMMRIRGLRELLRTKRDQKMWSSNTPTVIGLYGALPWATKSMFLNSASLALATSSKYNIILTGASLLLLLIRGKGIFSLRTLL